MDPPTVLDRSLVGRERERAQLEALIEDVVSRRGAYLGIWGAAGSGKSALLDHLDVDEMLLLSASGDPAEAGVRAAMLHQLTGRLLHPGSGWAYDHGLLDAAARDIADPTATADAAGRSLSALLDRLADEAPLLLAVDDVDHADPFSAEVLARLVSRPRRWGMILAGRLPPRALPTRTSTGSPLSDLHLGALSDTEARDLVAATAAQRGHGPTEPREPALVDDIVRWAAGNPGVLVRLTRALLTADVLRSDSNVDLARRVSSTVATLWLPRQDLSPEAQALGLMWAVATDCPGSRVLASVMPEELVDDVPLAELLNAGLLVRNAGQVEPVHPLLPAATLELAPSGDLRRAHAVLATAVEPDGLRAAWHRGQAATSTDHVTADSLERAVAASGTDLLPGERARALELAAALSVEPATRAARWALAAEARLAAGDPTGSVALVQRVDAADAAVSTRARVLLIEGLLAAASRTPQEGYEQLVRAAELAQGGDTELELAALASAAEVAWWSGRADWASQVADLTDRIRCTDAAARIVVEAVHGGAAMFVGDLETAGRRLRAAIAAGADATTAADHRVAGQAALLLGDEFTSGTHLAESVRLSREEGDVFRLAFTLQILASVETWRGHIGRAEELLDEGRTLTRRIGDERSHAFELSMSAHLEGLRGSGEGTAAAAGAALRLVTGRDVGYLPASALWALGRADLATGRLASALERLEEVTDPDAARGHPSAALFAIPDLVEAAARSGRDEIARAALPRFEAWAAAGSPWAQAVLPRLVALIAGDDEAEQWYAAASSEHDRPFERARAQLLYGEYLRRGRQRVRARAVLEDARATFEQLGTVPWAERATTELQATAEKARRGHDSSTELTPQELTVARLVAEGATNQQVAEQLFLSRKTVESHLHKVYTKLGIGSRKQLMDVLPADG